MRLDRQQKVNQHKGGSFFDWQSNPPRKQKQIVKTPKTLLSLAKFVDFGLIQDECMKPITSTDVENLHVQLIKSMGLLLLNCTSISQRRDMLEYMKSQDFLGMNEVIAFLIQAYVTSVSIKTFIYLD